MRSCDHHVKTNYHDDDEYVVVVTTMNEGCSEGYYGLGENSTK